MGRSVDLYRYDTNKLVVAVMEYCKTDDVALVNRILGEFGEVIGDQYIILNNEFWEEYDCYYNVASVLDRVFGVEDVFGNVFCRFSNESPPKSEMLSAMTVDDAMCTLFGDDYHKKYPAME